MAIQPKSNKITAKYMSLVQQFLDNNILTKEQLDTAFSEQKQTHEPLMNILIKRGFVSESKVAETVARDLGIRFLPSLNMVDWSSEAIDMFKADFLKLHKCIPLTFENNKLTIGISDPSNIMAIDAIQEVIREKSPGVGIEFVSVLETKVLEAIGEHYEHKQQSAIIDEDIKAAINHSMKQIGSDDDDAAAQPVEKLVDRLIILGASLKASDIHINPEETHVQIRYRIDSVLFTGPSIPKELQSAIVSRIKIMGKMNISEKRAPQDGKSPFRKENLHLDLRISVIPIRQGENIVIRILEKNKLFGLDQLGFQPRMFDSIYEVTNRSFGVFLVTGPTGAGKSTTLYSILQSMNAIERNVITLEDPIEYQLPFIRQSQVNVAVDYTFNTGLRAFLRHDPDVILVGEIRDKETAGMAFHAGQTGHFVLSTLHTNTAIGTVSRLLAMDLDLYLLSTILQGILAQRLARVICERCKEGYMATPVETKWLKLDEPRELKRGVGCDRCKQKGYSGRRGVFELFIPDDELCYMILNKASDMEIKSAAQRKDMPFFYDDARAQVLSGSTDFTEVIRTLPEIANG